MKVNIMKAALFSYPVLAMLFAGCTVGPDYQRPDVAEPETFLGEGRGATNQVSLTGWWKTLGDPVLEGLVERGMTNNLTLQIGIQRIRQSRAQMMQSTSGLWPSLTHAANYNYGRKFGPPGGVAYSATGSGINGEWGGTFAGGFDATWELDLFGGLRREVEAREAEFSGMHYTQRDLEVSLSAEIAMTYLNIRMMQGLLEVTRSNLVTQTRSATITRKRHQAKMVSGLDLSNADAQLQSTAAQIPALEADLADRVLQLELLLGELPNSRKEYVLNASGSPVLPEALPRMIPNELLRRRPDVRKAETVLHAATARIGVAKADLYPRLSLIGSVGASVPSSVSTWNDFTESVRLGPRLSWALFSAGRIRAQIEEKRAVMQQAVFAYQQVVLTAYHEAESAFQGYHQEARRTAPLMDAVAANQRAVRLAQELYKAGYSDYTEVLIAERSLLATESEAVRHRAALAQKLIQFYKALGGGTEVR